MGKLRHEIQKFSKGCPLDFHRCMFRIKHYAVLIVVNIRRILEKPVAVIDGNWNDSVVLARRMVYSSCIPLIFLTELALGIGTLLCVLCRSDCLRILLRLGEIDGDIQCPVFRIHGPLSVFFDSLSSDIITVTA